jgi:RND family efflux transporter MFP subunit
MIAQIIESMTRHINPWLFLRRLPPAALLALACAAAGPRLAWAEPLQSVTVQPSALAAPAGFEGRVEAVRQAQLAAQVSGAVVELTVQAGDRVRAGQVLLRIDARAAEQDSAARSAQVAAARAQRDVAGKELARQQQLYAQHYVSQAALDQAQAAWRAAQAQADALAAQAQAAQTQSGWRVVQAPFDGVVAQLAVQCGDMAMPGQPLLTVYDPARLRVSAAVPVSALAGLASGLPGARVLLAAQPDGQPITPVRVQVLPTVDPATHTQEVRAELPPGARAAPGLLARLLLPAPAGATQGAHGGGPHLFVPRTAIVQRAELTGLYVLDATGAPQLRQVRLGQTVGEQVEILSGLDAGERVATDPQAATRAAAQPVK